ncbi:retinol dehydrogenase 11-like [Amphiura filiformis]|uniref:retinol dehydrogenase 11-like n=1 Tax=Amphiura filiformis TaxID=82378 RepID=UPI003B21CB31
MDSSLAVPCVSVAVVATVGLYYYFVKVADKCTCTTRLDGKTVIITGANTGIGKATAEDLASRGARVILACRNKDKGIQAQQEIIQVTNNHEVQFMQLNLASFQSIRRFAEEIDNNEDRLDVLVNNAGVINDGSAKTEDGHELSFGVNHLGHFLLTNLLLDKLTNSAPSRVINVSSELYMMGEIDLDDLESYEGRMKSYPRSKLANILFTRELARKVAGCGISTFSLHPGSIDTDIKRNWTGWLQSLSPLISFLFLKNAQDGAQTSIHCAVADGIEKHSGKYFKGCRLQNVIGQAKDDVLAKRLWDISMKLTNLPQESTEQ